MTKWPKQKKDDKDVLNIWILNIWALFSPPAGGLGFRILDLPRRPPAGGVGVRYLEFILFMFIM